MSTEIYQVSQPLRPPLMSVLPSHPCRQLLHAHVLQSDREAVEKPVMDMGAHVHVVSSPSSRTTLPCKTREEWEGAAQPPPFLFPPYTRAYHVC